MARAIRIVNENIARINGTLKASGSVDGSFALSDGRSTRYHLDGTLFFLAPRHVRFDLKSFGDRKFLFGSNAEYFWYYSKEEEAYRCGPHGVDEELPPEIPVRPDQIVEALGLTRIPIESERATGTGAAAPRGPRRLPRVQGTAPAEDGGSSTLLAHRVVDDYQQILFVVDDEQGGVVLEKEYWLDRYRPRLVRRIVFRDCDGVTEMESRLDDYRALIAGGPLLPHLMTAEWPKTHAQMRFRVRRWTLVESVGSDSVQFTPPPECDDQ